MNEVKAGFYWFITATPNAITNFHQNCRGSFIKNIIGDVVLTFEEQFSGLILRNDPEFIKLSFNMPLTNYFNYQCFSPLYNTIKGSKKRTIEEAVDVIYHLLILLKSKKITINEIHKELDKRK